MDNILPKHPELVVIGRDFDIRSRQDNPLGIPVSTLPFGLPPGATSQPKKDLEELLCHPEDLPIYDLSRVQRFIPGDVQTDGFFGLFLHPARTTLEVERDLSTGKIMGLKEVGSKFASVTASNSVSRHRQPCTPKEALMGSNSNLPFLPAGMQAPNRELKTVTNLPWDTGPILTKPPGFQKGHQFHSDAKHSLKTAELLSTLQSIRTEHWLSQPTKEHKPEPVEDDSVESTSRSKHLLPEVDTIVNEVSIYINSREVPPQVLNIAETTQKTQFRNYEWAVMVPLNEPLGNFKDLLPDMAKEWDFELDLFQKHAILHLEKNDDVFVAAHTSAGKTVVAEYAIALTLNHGTRVIYTSPVKALSNQKYREFKKIFGDVGLLTGDIQVNEKASCLIMTTEILRSMLYRGAETIRELEWVIFDEVHYINDPERGVVWEEVLIMLPDTVKLVMLSATVSNVLDLADWIGITKKRKIFVISTLKRPIPLEHYLYTGAVGKNQDENFLLVDTNGQFSEKNYLMAKQIKEERISASQKNFGPKVTKYYVSSQQERNIYLGLLGYLRKQDKLPVICFTLSRKRCKQNAELLKSLDLLDKKQKSAIHMFFQKSISTLKPIDQRLPQIRAMASYLNHGFGVHHSGVLPILKEIVEMLFQKGLIKVLFATETFAIGVNMPARSVVFDSIRKHDGQDFRDLIASEYIQMAGRAGRRGLDTTGTVFIICKGEVPSSVDLKTMMLGKPQNVQSHFRVTYNMVLSLHRAKELKMEEILRRSFYEVEKERSKGKDKRELEAKVLQIAASYSMQCQYCSQNDNLSTYFDILQKHRDGTKNFIGKLFASKMNSKFFNVGRIVFVNINDAANIPGVILSTTSNKETLSLLLALKVNKPKVPENKDSLKLTPWKRGPAIIPVTKKDISSIEDVPLDQIVCITSTVITMNKKKTQKMRQDLDELKNAFLPELNNWVTEKSSMLKWFNFQDGAETKLQDMLQEILHWEEELSTLPCTKCPQFREHFYSKHAQLLMEESVEEMKNKLSDTSLFLAPNYHSCLQVLKELNYIDSQDILTMKGRVACELSSYELLLTELLIENVLSESTPAECAALLACTVFQQKFKVKDDLWSPALKKGVKEIADVAYSIEQVQRDFGLHQDPDYYILENLCFGLTYPVHQWAKGVSFAEIAELTEVEEGIIVRTIQRLVEVLKDIRNAAHIIGNDALKQKMEDASQAIKRDIVFAASLYTKD